MKKPKVIINCVANRYAAPDERIIEFSFPDGSGGLICFRMADHPVVDVYRCDKSVEIRGVSNGKKMDN